MVCAVLCSPRPLHTSQGSHSKCAKLSRVRLRVISTSPSEVKPLIPVRARSSSTAFLSSCSTVSRCSSVSISIKSIMMMPPKLRSRSCRAMHCAASKLVLKIVSDKFLPLTKLPVFTSTVVSASVWSKIK